MKNHWRWLNNENYFWIRNKKRIDQFLSEEIKEFSREKIKKLIRSNNVIVNGTKVTKPSYELRNNGIIEIIFNEEEIDKTLNLWEEGLMPKIIFECKDYLIIDKYSGLVVHPGFGNVDKTLVNILLGHKIPLSFLETNRPGIVHRLDKNTSGVMIIAKNDSFHKLISEQFEKGTVEKRYVLISENKYKDTKGIIEAPIGRDPNNRKLMKVQLGNSKFAKSMFTVIESFKKNDYVEFKIFTGRTHQIRVHCKFIGSPVLNDPEYGKKTFDISFGQFLHAKEISFLNSNGEKVTYESLPPFKFNDKLEQLRGNKVV